MDDLISRRAEIDAIDVLKRNYPSSCYEDLCKAVDIAIKALSAHPEIIQCKDCKYSYIFEPWEDAVRYCNRLRLACAKDSDMPVYDDDFCSLAERRTDGKAD